MTGKATNERGWETEGYFKIAAKLNSDKILIAFTKAQAVQ